MTQNMSAFPSVVTSTFGTDSAFGTQALEPKLPRRGVQNVIRVS